MTRQARPCPMAAGDAAHFVSAVLRDALYAARRPLSRQWSVPASTSFPSPSEQPGHDSGPEQSAKGRCRALSSPLEAALW